MERLRGRGSEEGTSHRRGLTNRKITENIIKHCLHKILLSSVQKKLQKGNRIQNIYDNGANDDEEANLSSPTAYIIWFPVSSEVNI